jgi:hypothetical protein
MACMPGLFWHPVASVDIDDWHNTCLDPVCSTCHPRVVMPLPNGWDVGIHLLDARSAIGKSGRIAKLTSTKQTDPAKSHFQRRDESRRLDQVRSSTWFIPDIWGLL